MTDQQETMFDEPADKLPSYEEEAAYEGDEAEPAEFAPEVESSIETMQAYIPEPVAGAVAEPIPEIAAEKPVAEPSLAQEETAAPAAVTPDLIADPLPILTANDFAALEERVLRAVSLVRREREARIEAEERALVLEGRVAGLQLEVAAAQRMQEEIEALRAEREQVRQRVERLLVQLDALEF